METLLKLTEGLQAFDWRNAVMIGIGLLLIYLAIKKGFEPMLLLPIGFGAILTNIPLSSAASTDPNNLGFLVVLYNSGIKNELFPILVFIAVGAMIDFSPLLKNPATLFFGAAAQLGIFVAMILAVCCGYVFPGVFTTIKEAAAIGVIGAADGPSALYVGAQFAPKLMGPIAVAAYSYMSLVPLIQPPIVKLLTTPEERRMKMDLGVDQPVSRTVRILFPIVITLVSGLIAPMSTALIGALMFGNLIRECTVLQRLSDSAQNELANLVTLLMGIAIGSTMVAKDFLTLQTLLIMTIGAIAFVFDTAGGVMFAKLANLVLKKKVNPMIGACGISAFPMSARVIQKMAQKEDPTNFILMPALGVNVAGQVGSIIATAMLLALLG